jgi:DNA polymerase
VALQSVATDAAFGLDAVPVRPRQPVVGGVGVEASDEAMSTAAAEPARRAPALEPSSSRSPTRSPTRAFESSLPKAAPPPPAASASSLIPQPIPTLSNRMDVRALHGASERAEALQALDASHASGCPHCTTATAHTRLVFGEGSPTARVMFVGEAPGETEDQLGRPFVGRAGQKLDEMIRAMGLCREDVYIANVLKSRPPENRTPLQHEVDRCGPYLIEQIRIVRPTVIVTLGGPATKLLLATEQGITRLRGVWASVEVPLTGADASPSEALTIPVMPTFHPAYLLRNYTPETRRQVWHDLQAVLATLNAAT